MLATIGQRLALLRSRLFSRTWWTDAARRGVNTATVIAIPYLGGSLLAEIPWLTILLATSAGFVGSIATSLAGLPETEGVNLPWWLAAVERVTKTFAQSIAAGLTAVVLITDVDWSFALQAAGIAALGSLLRLVLATLPADPTVRELPVGELEVVEMDSKGLAAEVAEELRGQVIAVHIQEPAPGVYNQPVARTEEG